MKSYEQMAQSLLERRDLYVARRKQNISRLIRYGVPTLCVILCIAVSVVLVSPEYSTVLVPSEVFASPSHFSSVAPSSGSQGDSYSYIDTPSVGGSLPSSSDLVASLQGGDSSKGNDFNGSAITPPTSQNNSNTTNSFPSDTESKVPTASIAPNPQPNDSYANYRDISQIKGKYSSRFDDADDFSFFVNRTFASKLDAPGDSNSSLVGGDFAATIYPMAPPTAEVENEHFFKEIQDVLFYDGYWCAPALIEEKSSFALKEIELNSIGLAYRFAYKSANANSYHLQFVLLANQYYAKQGLEKAKNDPSRRVFTHNGFVFYAIAHGDNRNTYTLFWQENGMYVIANLYDSVIPLEQLPPLLALNYYPIL